MSVPATMAVDHQHHQHFDQGKKVLEEYFWKLLAKCTQVSKKTCCKAVEDYFEKALICLTTTTTGIVNIGGDENDDSRASIWDFVMNATAYGPLTTIL